MDNFKKAIAALTAIISMASLGVGTISASAADLDAINEKILNDTATEEDKVIASCTDSGEIKAMEYLIDSNTSIEEVQLAKQIYDEGLKELQSTASNSCGLDFYSNNGLIPTRHYITLVDIKPNAPKDESILLNVKENIFTSNVEIGFLNPYTNSSRYSIHDIVYDDYGFMLRLKGNGINVSSPKLAGRNDLCFSTANLKNAAEAKGENASEKYLYDCLGDRHLGFPRPAAVCRLDRPRVLRVDDPGDRRGGGAGLELLPGAGQPPDPDALCPWH